MEPSHDPVVRLRGFGWYKKLKPPRRLLLYTAAMLLQALTEHIDYIMPPCRAQGGFCAARERPPFAADYAACDAANYGNNRSGRQKMLEF